MAFRRQQQEEPQGKPKRWIPSFEGGLREVDFKDTRLLSRFITERGKILPRRITGISSQQQRKITNAIKRARQLSLLPFINYGT